MFISTSYTYALIGASNAPEKYGNKIFLDLTQAGYHVLPINPKATTISGEKAYPKLEEVEGNIDVVIFVVPPQVTLEVLEEVVALGIKKVWMQPGSESDEAIAFCVEQGIACMHHACVMVQRKKEL